MGRPGRIGLQELGVTYRKSDSRFSREKNPRRVSVL